MASKRTSFALTLLLVCAVLLCPPREAGATHFPPGAKCVSCHSLSASTMITSTHLLKASQRTADMGFTNGGAVPCLFCHHSLAVAVDLGTPGPRSVMKGVEAHFDASSLSKHRTTDTDGVSGNYSRMTDRGSQNTVFDCLDCHTGITAGVAVGTGATIHGKDAATQTLNVYTETLIGTPADGTPAALTATCTNTACHQVGTPTDVSQGYSAPAYHDGFDDAGNPKGVTLPDGGHTRPTQCTQCHGKHNSFRATSLIALKTDGTISTLPNEDPANLATPDKCGACHNADDGSGPEANDYTDRGHGMSTIQGGLTCDDCHDSGVPHSFSSAGVATNPDRFAFTYNETTATKSGITSKATDSICIVCHSTFQGMVHGDPLNVGCLDCHEPHGKGMGTGVGDYNYKMVRRRIPVSGSTDDIVYKDPADPDNVGWIAANNLWYQGDTAGASGSSTGVCDNFECHGGRSINGDPVHPLSGLMVTGTPPPHTGGQQADGAACAGCHTHGDSSGVWAAGQSCDNCHGFPPATNAHTRHVSDAGLGCENCHPDPGVANHNETDVSNATEFNANWDTVRDNVDVAFTQSTAYTVGTYSLAKGGRPTGAAAADYGTCTSQCHGAGLDASNYGTQITPTWSNTDARLDAGNGDGTCGTCHKKDNSLAGTTPNSGSHLLHAGSAGRAFGCQMCHWDTTHDGTTVVGGGKHVNGAKDIVGGGTFPGARVVNVTYTSGTNTCSAISCHGNYSNVSWAAAAGNCGNCHGTFIGGMVGVVARHKAADWSDPKGDGAATRFDVSHKGAATGAGNGEEYCDFCHANTQAAYTGATMHIDGQVQVNSVMGYQGTSTTGQADQGCGTACHPNTSPYQMSETNLPITAVAGQAFGCGACHKDATIPPTSGAHTAHFKAIDGIDGATAGGNTDYSECEACHGNNLTNSYTIANGGSGDGDNHGNGSVTFVAGITRNDGGTPNDPSDDTCLTTVCHSPNNTVPNPANWTDPTATSIGCNECHYWSAAPASAANGTDGNALGGSHGDHFAGAADSRQVLCTDCHADNSGDTGGGSVRTHITTPPGLAVGTDDGAILTARANPAQDAAGLLGTVLGATGANPDQAPWGVDATSNATCDNTQCHNPSDDGHISPAWATAATGSCETCHGASAATPPSSNAHPKHTGNGADQFSFSCKLCHYATTTDGTTITSLANHVNQLANVAFDSTDPRLSGTSTYGGTSTVGDSATDAGDFCSSTYCHSRGTTFTEPWEPPMLNAEWDTTSFCNCHEFVPLYPDGTPKGNKHLPVHVNFTGGCPTCHYESQGHTASTHVNQQYDIKGDVTNDPALDDFTYSYVAGGGDCSAARCHGGNTVNWGYDVVANGKFPCESCHATTGGVPETTDLNDFNRAAVVNDTTVMSKVSSTEFSARGHGAHGVTCSDCHDSSVDHPFGFAEANPFRLVDQDGGTAGVQFSCSYNNAACHQGTTAGGVDYQSIVVHSDEAMATAGYTAVRTWPVWDPDCVNCHDPHGDDSNLSMIQRELYDKAAFNLPAGPPPAEPTEQTGLVFTDNTTGADTFGTSYADLDTPFSAVCQECHEATNHVSFKDGTSAAATNHPGTGGNPGACSTCHQHDSGFKPSGCNGCHGDLASGQYWPDGVGGNPAYVDDSAGSAASHDSHMEPISQYLYGQTSAQLLADAATDTKQKAICVFCHFDPGGSGHTTDSGDARVDVIGDGVSAGTFTAFAVAAQATKADGNGVGSYNTTAKTCSNVDCHYETPTPTYGTAGWDGGDTGVPTCETCHFYRDGGSFPTVAWTPATPQLPDAHQVHVAGIAQPSADQSKSYPCSYCHAVTGYTTAHTNGAIDLSTAGNPTLLKDGNGGDEAMTPTNTAVKYGAGTANTSCSNLYCHGADFSVATQGTNVAPVWNNHLTAYCTTCHDVDTRGTPGLGQTFTQGQHRTHVPPGDVAGFDQGPSYNYHAASCVYCHGADPSSSAGCGATACHSLGGSAGAGTPSDEGFATFPSRSHVEGNFEVDFEGSGRGWNNLTDFTGTPGTLTTLGTADNNGTDICNRCHSTASVNGNVGATLAKTNWTTASYRLPCENCHNAASGAFEQPVTGGVQAPGKDTNYAAAGHGKVTDNVTYGGSNCSDCHAEDSVHLTGALGEDRLDVLNFNDYAVDPNAFCGTCHSGTVETVHYTNAQSVVGTNSSDDGNRCNICHDPHGQSGQDAMIVAAIGARNVTGFADKTLRSSYFSATPGTGNNWGVCQVCHDENEVQYFNRTTEADATHNPGLVCTACHQHDKSVAFTAICTDCHGGGVAAEGNNNYWPDDQPTHGTAYPNRLGSHQRHIDAIYNVNLATLPGATATDKKNATCDWCHPSGGHTGDQAAAPADLHDTGTPVDTGTRFKDIGGDTDADGQVDVQDGATNVSCATINCHYNQSGDNYSMMPADWYSLTSQSACTYCHGGNTSSGYTVVADTRGVSQLPNAHDIHVRTVAGGGYEIDCIQCHLYPGSAQNHQNDVVEMKASYISVPVAESNANQTITRGAAPLDPKYGTGTSATQYSTCSGFYCHGDFSGGNAANAPNWFNTAVQVGAGVADGRCGTCHDTGTFDSTPGTSISSGNHTDHLSATYGPGFGTGLATVCDNCHTASAAHTTHVDGNADFDNIAVSPASSPLGTLAVTTPTATDTDRCTNCHSTATVNAQVGTVQAKANWATGAFQLDCLYCHNGIDAGTNNADGTGRAAPNMLGDDTNYGAEVRGHNRPTASGIYPVSGNTAANRACSDCHNLTATHLNNTDDTTYAGNRLLTTINSTATGSTVSGACNACHATTGASPATKKSINTHGNTGYAGKLEPATFTTTCNQCHEPHGLVSNGGGYNIYMMNPTITVTGGTTVGGVRLEAKSGNYSFNDTLGTNADDLCATCHTNASNPGTPMTWNADGNHAAPAYTKDERGNDCTACHTHNQDSALATVDGLMPLACNGCHTYPGLPGSVTDPSLHRLSAVHDVHVGVPSDEAATPNKGFACSKCHNGSAHNSAASTGGTITGPAQWATNVAPNLNNRVQVRFDSWNPVAQANNPVGTDQDSTSFNDTTNVCSNLYCHGATLAAAGSNSTPDWDVVTTADCGTCHDTGTFDTTVGTSIATGNHTDHLSAVYGPNFGTGSAAVCANCHPAYAVNAATHVNTTKDFANLVTTTAVTSVLGTTAPAGAPDGTSTDRCNNCHSTFNLPTVGVGAALAKTNWSNGSYSLDCRNCHNATDPASENADGTGAAAPGKDTYWDATTGNSGHGLRAISSYPWGAGRSGAALVCTDCHNSASAHINAAATEDRLSTTGNALCNSCHDGAGAGSAATQVSTHANTSTTMAGTYTAKEPSFELDCVECHDVHGTANLFMINEVNADGPLDAGRQYGGITVGFLFNGTVAFTDDSVGTSATSGVGYAHALAADASKICQTCHTETGFYQFDGDPGHVTSDCITCHAHDIDADYTATSQDGFMPSGCSGCHGFPPVPPARAGEGGHTDYLAENYTDGGGMHIEHVEFLQSKLGGSTNAQEICGPCHGDGAGSTNHAGSGESSGAWAIASRGFVNLTERTASSWDGMAGDPAAGSYGGTALPTTANGNAVDAADSTCAGVDCHGNPVAGEVLHWNVVMTDTATTNDGLIASQVCEGCHDETPAQVRVYNAAGTIQYTGNAPNAAANYYGTLSGYARGGHGDLAIQSETPFVNSDPSHTTPIDCTACHDGAATHFPETANLHRLSNPTIEESTHNTGLCNGCHAGGDYPTNHHPSFWGSTLSNGTAHIIEAGAGQEVLSAPSTWTDQGGGHYEQDGYSASGWSGNTDYNVDWWGGSPGTGNQDPPPTPAPLSSLPLERYVLNSGASNVVMCVTCHNPHGTDLFTFDAAGGHQSIPDNNMLRLRDSDNTLCNACH